MKTTARTDTALEPARAGAERRLRARTLVVGALVALAGAGIVLANAAGIDGTLTRLADDDLAVVVRGEALYAEQCASCHGANLEGQPNWRQRDANGLLPAPPHDETGHTWHHADDLLFEITKYGPGAVIGDDTYRSAMPAYASVLSDEEIVAVLSYIKSRWPEKERTWQEDVNRSQLEAAGELDADESLLERLFK